MVFFHGSRIYDIPLTQQILHVTCNLSSLSDSEEAVKEARLVPLLRIPLWVCAEFAVFKKNVINDCCHFFLPAL